MARRQAALSVVRGVHGALHGTLPSLASMPLNPCHRAQSIDTAFAAPKDSMPRKELNLLKRDVRKLQEDLQKVFARINEQSGSFQTQLQEMRNSIKALEDSMVNMMFVLQNRAVEDKVENEEGLLNLAKYYQELQRNVELLRSTVENVLDRGVIRDIQDQNNGAASSDSAKPLEPPAKIEDKSVAEELVRVEERLREEERKEEEAIPENMFPQDP